MKNEPTPTPATLVPWLLDTLEDAGATEPDAILSMLIAAGSLCVNPDDMVAQAQSVAAWLKDGGDKL